MQLVGIDYEEGYGTPIDYLAAGKYYCFRVRRKDLDGCSNLGALYDDGSPKTK